MPLGSRGIFCTVGGRKQIGRERKRGRKGLSVREGREMERREGLEREGGNRSGEEEGEKGRI